MPKYTKEQLQQYQDEIRHYYKMRRLFLGLGWACIGVGLFIGLPIGIIIASNGGNYELATWFTSISIVAGLVLFVLRGAMFNRRIKNRKQIIREAKEDYAIESMYEERAE